MTLSVYLSTREAAVRLSIGASTLKKLRVNGFHRIGRHVVYSPETLNEWAKRKRFRTTSEYRQKNPRSNERITSYEMNPFDPANLRLSQNFPDTAVGPDPKSENPAGAPAGRVNSQNFNSNQQQIIGGNRHHKEKARKSLWMIEQQRPFKPELH